MCVFMKIIEKMWKSQNCILKPLFSNEHLILGSHLRKRWQVKLTMWKTNLFMPSKRNCLNCKCSIVGYIKDFIYYQNTLYLLVFFNLLEKMGKVQIADLWTPLVVRCLGGQVSWWAGVFVGSWLGGQVSWRTGFFSERCLGGQVSWRTGVWVGRCFSGQVYWWEGVLVRRCISLTGVLVGRWFGGQVSYWADVLVGRCLMGQVS